METDESSEKKDDTKDKEKQTEDKDKVQDNIHCRMSGMNAGQLGLESSRPESSRPGSTRPGYILYCLLFSPLFS